jgi:formate dehydrogenase major subunit/formate dehydrogenase alpha subunit
LAPEALAALSFDGEIEMNPADAYPLGCLPGDAVNVSLRLGELSGRLALNIHLPRGLVAVPASMMQAVSGGTPVESKIYAAKVEKK